MKLTFISAFHSMSTKFTVVVAAIPGAWSKKKGISLVKYVQAIIEAGNRSYPFTGRKSEFGQWTADIIADNFTISVEMRVRDYAEFDVTPRQ